jgi:hypothetical protein
VRIEWSPAARASARRYLLKVGRYRIKYVVEDDLITIERVDRVV